MNVTIVLGTGCEVQMAQQASITPCRGGNVKFMLVVHSRLLHMASFLVVLEAEGFSFPFNHCLLWL